MPAKKNNFIKDKDGKLAGSRPNTSAKTAPKPQTGKKVTLKSDTPTQNNSADPSNNNVYVASKRGSMLSELGRSTTKPKKEWEEKAEYLRQVDTIIRKYRDEGKGNLIKDYIRMREVNSTLVAIEEDPKYYTKYTPWEASDIVAKNSVGSKAKKDGETTLEFLDRIGVVRYADDIEEEMYDRLEMEESPESVSVWVDSFVDEQPKMEWLRKSYDKAIGVKDVY